MKQIRNIFCGLFILGGFIALSSLLHAQETANPLQVATDLGAMLQAVEQTTPLPADAATDGGNFYSAQHAPGSDDEWPPLPGNIRSVPVWPMGNDVYLLDDLGLDYNAPQLHSTTRGGGMHAMDDVDLDPGDAGDGGTNTYTPSVPPPFTPTTNDLWLQINGVTNGVMGWTAYLTIHTPWNDTNLTHDLFYTTSLDAPINWQFLMRCPSTNVVATGICGDVGFFGLGQTNGNLTVSTNSTAQQLAQLLVPPWITPVNAKYTGAIQARGTFAGGNGCGLPIDSGVILSSGIITNAIGPNTDDGSIAAGIPDNYPNGPSNLGQINDTDLNNLVETNLTFDAAVLEFDIVSTNSFTLQFQYIYASEEYPEWIGSPPYNYNDPMAIFVSTNRLGTNWINSITNDFALVPGTTNMPVSVNTINGGFIGGSFYGSYLSPASPTNQQYYVDNCDPNYVAATNAAPVREFNVQYDGMTVLLTAQTYITAGFTNHVKIAIEDYGDPVYDSAVFIAPASTPCN